MLTRIWFLLTALPICRAHMEMMLPPPIKSSFNPFYNYLNIDYSYNNPLGSYPCKGYHRDEPRTSVANYTVGMPQRLKLFGETDHLGGSCQISLSYDAGLTFTVIKSIIGGCPVKQEYEFSVPDSSPNGQALLSWSWINHEGNRDFYQNCAWVNIINTNTSVTVEDFHLQGPDMFKAGLPGECVVLENYDFVYPEPGDVVEYGEGGTANFTTICEKCMSGNLTYAMGSNSVYDPSSNLTCRVLSEQPLASSDAASVATTPTAPISQETYVQDLSALSSQGYTPAFTAPAVTEKEHTQSLYRRLLQSNSTTLMTVQVEATMEPMSPSHYEDSMILSINRERERENVEATEASLRGGEHGVSSSFRRPEVRSSASIIDHQPSSQPTSNPRNLLSKDDRPASDARDPRKQCEQCVYDDDTNSEEECDGDYSDCFEALPNFAPPPRQLPHPEHAERPHRHFYEDPRQHRRPYPRPYPSYPHEHHHQHQYEHPHPHEHHNQHEYRHGHPHPHEHHRQRQHPHYHQYPNQRMPYKVPHRHQPQRQRHHKRPSQRRGHRRPRQRLHGFT